MNMTERLELNRTTRRKFLSTSGQAVAATALTPVSALPGYTAGNDNITVALVGGGGRGTGAAANALATQSGPIRLIAMADVFKERLATSYEALKGAADKVETGIERRVGGFAPTQVDVPPERRFLGFEAYQKAMDCLKPGDVVILTTPVAFRWVHFRYALEKRLNVFMEKPISLDGPTTRRMLELGEQSVKQNLKVGVGLMCRHCKARWELYDRIQQGAIGEIL